MKKLLYIFFMFLIFISCKKETETTKSTNSSNESNLDYEFVGGYPTESAIKKAYDDADLTRAIQAYKFFYPTVSGEGLVKGNDSIKIIPNKSFGTLDTKPGQIGFTLNSDTPYGPIPIDLSGGPMIIDIPKGPLIVVAMDVNQRWVADMGIPGPDAGNGGKHLLLPPGYKGVVPASGYHVWKSSSNNLTVGIRSLPVGGDVKAAIERIKTVKVYPLNKPSGWTEPTWLDLTDKPQNTTPVAWENNIKYWENLNDVIQREPTYDGYRNYYGELAVLGIKKGQPFKPDGRLKAILEKAAKIANAQMRVQSFADRRSDRIVWKDRQWEWVALRFEDGDFNTKDYVDLDGRETWFYQAIGASPSMFRRKEGFGSLYWLGLKDAVGKYVDGGKNYKLTIPTPVPAKLFWSITIYDAITRSQVATDQNKAALRSLFELKDKIGGNSVDLYFGPKAPAGKEGQWIKTLPNRGWFAYIRIYGPEGGAFNNTWKPGDFEEIK